MFILAQTQRYIFPYKFLLSAIYDAADQIGARLIDGNSRQGVLRIRMPENYGELLVQVSSIQEDCEITLTADASKPPGANRAQESDGAQYFFSVLNEFLLSFMKT